MADLDQLRVVLDRLAPADESAPVLPFRAPIQRLTYGEAQAEAAELIQRLVGIQ